MKIIQINSIQKERKQAFFFFLSHVCRHSLNRFYIRERGTPSNARGKFATSFTCVFVWTDIVSDSSSGINKITEAQMATSGEEDGRQAGEASASKTKQGVPKQCFTKVARQNREKRKKESPFFNRN